MARIVMELLLSLLHMGIIRRIHLMIPLYYYVSEGMQEPLKYVGDRAKSENDSAFQKKEPIMINQTVNLYITKF